MGKGMVKNLATKMEVNLIIWNRQVMMIISIYIDIMYSIIEEYKCN